MGMTPDKWKEAKVLFEAALDRPSDCRLQFLEDSCADDRLRAEVARLLAEHEDAGSSLSKIAARQGDQAFRNDVDHLLANQNFPGLLAGYSAGAKTSCTLRRRSRSSRSPGGEGDAELV